MSKYKISTMSVLNIILMTLFVGAGFASAQVYLSVSTGDYASIQTNGEGNSGWEGFSINGRYNFMSSSNTTVGIYDDINDRWRMYWDEDDFTIRHENGDILLQADEDSYTDLYYDNSWKISAHPDGARINGKVKANEYCDSDGNNCSTPGSSSFSTTYDDETYCGDELIDLGSGFVTTPSVGCPVGYELTGCGGYNNHTSAELHGVVPSLSYCRTYAWSNFGFNSNKCLTTYALCGKIE